MKRSILYLISLLFLAMLMAWPQQAAQAAPLPRPVAQTVTGDMFSPRSDLSQCLTVNGANVTTAPDVILDTCHGATQQLWTHNAGAGQWQTELKATVVASTVPPVKVNSQLAQVSFVVASSTTTPDVTYPAQSTQGVLVATFGLNKLGGSLCNIAYRVKALTNGNYLLNADSGPGQVDSTLTVSNSALPGGNQLWHRGLQNPL